jgi:hypothetical protein
MANELGHCVQNSKKASARTTNAHVVDHQRSPVSRSRRGHSVQPVSSTHSPTSSLDYHRSVVRCPIQHNPLDHILDNSSISLRGGRNRANLKSWRTSSSIFSLRVRFLPGPVYRVSHESNVRVVGEGGRLSP